MEFITSADEPLNMAKRKELLMTDEKVTIEELDEIDAMLDESGYNPPGVHITEHTCANCGKTFVAAPFHVFHDRSLGLWFCKYTCELNYRRAHGKGGHGAAW